MGRVLLSNAPDSKPKLIFKPGPRIHQDGAAIHG